MPNWCFTNYVITGDEAEVSDLYEKLSSLPEREDVVENDFGKLWLGNVVGLFGGDYEKIYCRGSISGDIERHNPTEIHFITETAWSDMSEVWDFVLKQYPSLKYYYQAEESGCCYYATNDAEGKYFPERYIVDQWDKGTEYFDTQAEAMKDVSERLGQPIESWEDMLNKLKTFNSENEDNGIYINEIKVQENNHE